MMLIKERRMSRRYGDFLNWLSTQDTLLTQDIQLAWDTLHTLDTSLMLALAMLDTPILAILDAPILPMLDTLILALLDFLERFWLCPLNLLSLWMRRKIKKIKVI